eukprot:CAMPEP_0172826436 /NCGR_PEP_ID=MMETSP1075-20121228/19414_1 /TAXON_ID=2916 /ORGANISM="Ceratium fusus, Strain PA161109" /LENGTH=60 /DNA_ID=CAMNT_0013668081 /DNA_START=924 /DNA_END=1106 /DNA_ORIENTATION=+
MLSTTGLALLAPPGPSAKVNSASTIKLVLPAKSVRRSKLHVYATAKQANCMATVMIAVML